jgi:hypothetical protein
MSVLLSHVQCHLPGSAGGSFPLRHLSGLPLICSCFQSRFWNGSTQQNSYHRVRKKKQGSPVRQRSSALAFFAACGIPLVVLLEWKPGSWLAVRRGSFCSYLQCSLPLGFVQVPFRAAESKGEASRYGVLCLAAGCACGVLVLSLGCGSDLSPHPKAHALLRSALDRIFQCRTDAAGR